MNKMWKLIYFVIFIMALSSCAKQDPICNNKNTIGDINGVEFSLEVACSLEEVQKGLMFRDKLEPNSGMIFVHAHEDFYAFWMKNTNIPLSIAFLNSKHQIVDIRHMQPHDLTPVPTRTKALYAIEMNLGWFESNGIKIGDTLRLVQ